MILANFLTLEFDRWKLWMQLLVEKQMQDKKTYLTYQT